MIRRLAHELLGWRPSMLLATIRRYRYASFGHVWRQDTAKAAVTAREAVAPRGLRRALEGIVVQHLTFARVAEALAVSWNTANDAILADRKRPLIDPVRQHDRIIRPIDTPRLTAAAVA